MFTGLFFFYSSRDESSSRQKRVNSKRHLNVDRDDFIPGRVSSGDEISRVNTIFVSVTCKRTLSLIFSVESNKVPSGILYVCGYVYIFQSSSAV